MPKQTFSDAEVILDEPVAQDEVFPDDAVMLDEAAPPQKPKRGLLEGKTWTGLAKNAARNAFVDIPVGIAQMAGMVGKMMMSSPAEQAAAGEAILHGAKDVAGGVKGYAQAGAADPGAVLHDVVDAAYNNPIDAATMVTPAGWGKQTALSLGGKVAPKVTRVLSRDAGKLLEKSDALMDSVLRKTATAERNNPDKNFARILSREGYLMGLTKGEQGIITKEGASALAKRVAGLRNEATSMRAASPAKVTASSMVKAMDSKIDELARVANDPSDLEQARHMVERVKNNPDLFQHVEIPNSGPVLGPKFSNVLGPDGKPVQIGVARGPNRTKVVPQEMSITQYARRREGLRDANLKKTDAGQWYSPSEYTKKVDLAAQHEMRRVERDALGARYEALQALRSDLIPAQRVAAGSVRNDAHKSMFGLSNMMTLGPMGYMGAKVGDAVLGKVGAAIGALGGGYGGHQLGSYLKSVGRTSAKASKLYGKALLAPAHNASVMSMEPILSTAINVAPTATALFEAIREQTEAARQRRQETAQHYASASTSKP